MIFWKHIKGLSSDNYYTFLRFEPASGVTRSPSADYTNQIFLPHIFIQNATSGFSDLVAQDCGYVITSEISGGAISKSFTFNKDVTIKDFLILNKTISGNTKSLKIEWDATNDNNKWKYSSEQDLQFQSSNILFDATGNITIKHGTNKEIVFERVIRTNKIIVEEAPGNEKEKYPGSCTAVYFNATSDYRAKKDFKLLDIDALELIKKVQLYSFKYKESNQPSIGIIAQDVQDVNINGFELVDNKEASGANFDYMSIHESKLIYILWKAIQEQQKEIEELKQQLK